MPALIRRARVSAMLRRSLRKQDSNLGLYLGFESANHRARAEGRREVEDDEEGDSGLPPSVVVLRCEGDGYSVSIEPPLPCGDHQSFAETKADAWNKAQALWSKHRLGLADRTHPNLVRHNHT